jgi:hypothetical protein
VIGKVIDIRGFDMKQKKGKLPYSADLASSYNQCWLQIVQCFKREELLEHVGTGSIPLHRCVSGNVNNRSLIELF